MKFLILIHPKEAKKERIGTGRIVHHALAKSELLIGVDFTHDKVVNHYLDQTKYHTYLMYPGESSIPVEKLKKQNSTGPESCQKETVIILLDGTWPFAKKMLRKSLNLHNISRIKINTNNRQSIFEIKQQPHESCLSTLEAIVVFLDECEENNIEKLSGVQSNLLKALEELVRFQKECALDKNLIGHRKGPYKSVNRRTPSKKWQQYSIFYKG